MANDLSYGGWVAKRLGGWQNAYFKGRLRQDAYPLSEPVPMGDTAPWAFLNDDGHRARVV